MTPGSVVPLGRASRRARWAAAAVGLFLLTAGTLVGTDDDFPLGPLRMYAVRDDPNGTVTEAVVLARTEPGRLKDVTDTAGAPRRAELEGRFGELSGDPARFAPIARSFEPRSGLVDGRAVTTIILVRRSYPLHDGRSGPAQDRVVATWTVPR